MEERTSDPRAGFFLFLFFYSTKTGIFESQEKERGQHQESSVLITFPERVRLQQLVAGLPLRNAALGSCSAVKAVRGPQSNQSIPVQLPGLCCYEGPLKD